MVTTDRSGQPDETGSEATSGDPYGGLVMCVVTWSTFCEYGVHSSAAERARQVIYRSLCRPVEASQSYDTQRVLASRAPLRRRWSIALVQRDDPTFAALLCRVSECAHSRKQRAPLKPVPTFRLVLASTLSAAPDECPASAGRYTRTLFACSERIRDAKIDR